MVDRTTFKSLLMDTGSKSKLLFQSFIEKVPIFTVLNAQEKEQLLDVMKPADFNQFRQSHWLVGRAPCQFSGRCNV